MCSQEVSCKSVVRLKSIGYSSLVKMTSSQLVPLNWKNLTINCDNTCGLKLLQQALSYTSTFYDLCGRQIKVSKHQEAFLNVFSVYMRPELLNSFSHYAPCKLQILSLNVFVFLKVFLSYKQQGEYIGMYRFSALAVTPNVRVIFFTVLPKKLPKQSH